ncbi:MAG: hypothetical protein BWY99_01798 [Synergistetes bacterium ADurb.BinA166]|nr:MAG: hypothetical protein BWY99_01798 [Synergistetes bacterium ADurb.BinA166]
MYYDDITKHIGEEIKKHNRIALILQGLLDRSAVFHPHPPWQIWTPAGFAQALDLVYDDSRALPSGPPPDFEAFRARLNSSIKPGTVTIGQQRAWLLHEGKKESDRRDRDYRHRGENYRPTTHQPYGNPGPGDLARVESCPKSGRCTFSWTRELQSRHRSGEESRVSFTCGSSRLLNADAYEPGDFRQFFEDPRTRVDYLKWAPLLLEAEEYKAGNRKFSSPVPSPAKPVPTEEGRERYRRKKMRKYLIGKAVRLRRVVETRGGRRYETGSLWRVSGSERGKFSIHGILPDGSDEVTRSDSNGYDVLSRHVADVLEWDITVDLTIPSPPDLRKDPSPSPTPDAAELGEGDDSAEEENDDPEEDDDPEAEEDAEEDEEDAEGTIEDHEDCMDDEPLPDDDD